MNIPVVYSAFSVIFGHLRLGSSFGTAYPLGILRDKLREQNGANISSKPLIIGGT